MRTKWILCAALLILLPLAGPVLQSASVATAQTPGNTELAPEKEPQPTGTPTFEGRVEGDTIETAFVIDYIPVTVWGDTCPFLNDYDESCPYTGSTSPDVVYSYYCNHSCTVTIDLCASEYDTKVYVYENEYTPGSPLACNDDSPGCGPSGYRSWLMTEFVYGNTYYVVVDGYTGACGDYELRITDYLPCALCPPGAYGETEPDCIIPGIDIDNGGCNSDPPVFDYLEPSEDTIDFCGTSGTYSEGSQNYRDTDWYQIDLSNESEITFRGIANFPMRIGIVDGREGCENVSSFYSYMDVPTCSVAQLTETLPAGTWWLWVGPTQFTGVPCGAEYECELTGYMPATPVENTSWSTVKALYR